MGLRKDDVRCITIIHAVNQVQEYRWLAAFFRLAGIWVCENIEGDEHGDETDFYLLIKAPEANCGSGWELMSYWKSGDVKSDLSASLRDDLEYSEKTWIRVVLDAMKVLFTDRSYDDLNDIADIFIEFDLMRGSYAIEYFADVDEPEIYDYMRESKKNFHTAYGKLLEKEKEDSSKYFLSVLCNCLRRNNELYTILWNAYQRGCLTGSDKELNEVFLTPYLEYGRVEEWISRILTIDPGFYAAYAIRGFIKKVDEKRDLESVYDFERAANCCGDKSYVSCMLYRIAAYYGEIQKNTEFEDCFYQRSYERDSYNYRAAYKIAMKQKCLGDYNGALDMCVVILNLLEKKAESPSLQPVECAYLYKTYLGVSDIHMTQKKYREAIPYLEKAVAFGKLNKNMVFYQWMFGNYAEIFKRAAVNKLDLYYCYQKLSNAYELSSSQN